MNKNIINIKPKNWRACLCNIIFIKDFNNQKNPLFFWSLIYNLFLQSISLLGFIPMFYSFFISEFKEYQQLAVFYFVLLILIISYIIDFFLRLLVIDLHYNQKSYKKALLKQLISFCSNYQLISFFLIYGLVIAYGTYENNGIFFNHSNFSNDIAMVVFSVILLLNLASIFPRFIFSSVDIRNYEITKKIIYSRRKSIIFSLCTMFFFWLLFSFIVFKLEQNYYNNLPANEIPSDAINNIGNAMYFTFVAMTTVGFGDFVPHAPETKAIVDVLAIFGVCFYAYVGSIFVNIYVEYINRKKTIRNTLFNNKWNQIQNEQILNSINKIFVDNLFNAGLINQEKYDEMIESLQQGKIKNQNKNNIRMEDIKIDENKLFINNTLIGLRIFDNEQIEKAQNDEKIAVFNPTKNMQFNQMLYFLPSLLIKKIYKSDSLPILFAKENEEFDGIDTLIFFQKKPIPEAIFQVNLSGKLKIDKDLAWNSFGKFSLIHKKEFDEIFKKSEKVNVLFIKEFFFFNQKISLENYAINTNWKIKNMIYLI